MPPPKILIIIGTRPDVIKLAPVIRILKERKQEITTQVCLTHQHQEMVNKLLKLFKISPDFDLNLMETDQTLSFLSAKMLQAMENLWQQTHSHLVLVQGDTTTAFMAALAAFYHGIPIAHLEAGLRTYDRFQPFPEEINRTFITKIADLHFAPTETARKNLLKEKVPPEKIYLTGNTIIDALEWIWKDINPDIIKDTIKNIDWSKKIILVTAHRRENFGAGLTSICKTLLELRNKEKEIEIIYPVHLNPQVFDPVHKILKNQERIHLIDPLHYPEFLSLLDHSYLILSDSGGIQEEASFFGKPALVMRKVTERVESQKAGIAILVDTKPTTILKKIKKLLHQPEEYQKRSRKLSLYGDGIAAPRVCDILIKFIKNNSVKN